MKEIMMTVIEIQEAIRIAEAAGDMKTSKQLKVQLKQCTINEG